MWSASRFRQSPPALCMARGLKRASAGSGTTFGSEFGGGSAPPGGVLSRPRLSGWLWPFHGRRQPRLLPQGVPAMHRTRDTWPGALAPGGRVYGNVSPASGGALKRIRRSGMAPRLILDSRPSTRYARHPGRFPSPPFGDPWLRRRHLPMSRNPLFGALGATAPVAYRGPKKEAEEARPVA